MQGLAPGSVGSRWLEMMGLRWQDRDGMLEVAQGRWCRVGEGAGEGWLKMVGLRWCARGGAGEMAQGRRGHR